MRSFCFLVFILQNIFLFALPSSDLNQGLRALQQIRSLIPERFSEQEFDILVDVEGFQKPIDALCSHKFRETAIPSTCILGSSNNYLLRWTLSGEAVRILDSYQEFEYGPFWKYPTALEKLEDMESSVYRIDQ